MSWNRSNDSFFAHIFGADQFFFFLEAALQQSIDVILNLLLQQAIQFFQIELHAESAEYIGLQAGEIVFGGVRFLGTANIGE